MTTLRLALVLLFCCQIVSSHLLRREEISSIEPRGQISPRNHASWKIIGGEIAPIEKYPYVVSLQQNGTFFGHDFEHFCVGNIIGEKWILTAAKCCIGKNTKQFHARIGSESYYTGGQIHEIESIQVHPKYDELSWDYDVGLLKLKESVSFGTTVQTIELPKAGSDVNIGTVLEITGWGATKLLGMPSDMMYRNSVPTISQADCRSVYSANAVTDRMFCVFEEGNGPCIGDTGSPAVLGNVLFGVASWSQSCAYKYPTAYARLPEMVDWITEVTGIQQSESSLS